MRKSLLSVRAFHHYAIKLTDMHANLVDRIIIKVGSFCTKIYSILCLCISCSSTNRIYTSLIKNDTNFGFVLVSFSRSIKYFAKRLISSEPNQNQTNEENEKHISLGYRIQQMFLIIKGFDWETNFFGRFFTV